MMAWVAPQLGPTGLVRGAAVTILVVSLQSWAAPQQALTPEAAATELTTCRSLLGQVRAPACLQGDGSPTVGTCLKGVIARLENGASDEELIPELQAILERFPQQWGPRALLADRYAAKASRTFAEAREDPAAKDCYRYASNNYVMAVEILEAGYTDLSLRASRAREDCKLSGKAKQAAADTATGAQREVPAACTQAERLAQRLERYSIRHQVDVFLLDLKMRETLTLAEAKRTPTRSWGNTLLGRLRGAVSEELPLPIEFEFAKVSFTDATRGHADSLALYLKGDEVIDHLILEGHADRIGTEEVNCDLSFRRAMAVVEHLCASGVQGKRFTVAAYGENVPRRLSDNTYTEEEMRRLNRRVSARFSMSPKQAGLCRVGERACP